MSADLQIHVMTDGMDETTLRCFFKSTLGSKWNGGLMSLLTAGNGCLTAPRTSQFDCEHWKAVADSPSYWVGEVSWLKAGLTDDPDTFVPDPVGRVHDLLEDAPVLDGALGEALVHALMQPNGTGYTTAEPDEKLVEFLREHQGRRLFTVSW